MRYLRPIATPIKVKDKTYNVLFTLEIIDELQQRAEMPVTDIIDMTLKEKSMETAASYILKVMFPNEEIELEEFNYISVMLVSAFVEQAKSKKMELPKPQETSEETEFIDVEWWVYFGTVVLGYSEQEVWKMTLGKIGTLYREHLKYRGVLKEDKEVNIDDVI